MLSKATSESKSALNATSPHENRSKKQLSASANQSNKEYEGVDPAVLCVDDAGPTDTYISRAYYYAYRYLICTGDVKGSVSLTCCACCIET